MIQEYLLQDVSEKDAIKKYKPKGIHKKMFSADDGNCIYVQFSADGENEETAKKLSEIDEYVHSNFHVTVLKDGCSEYFSNRIYPLICGFEYNLRKLLYLTSAINHDEKTSSNIADLESKDFGQIFSLLFIDSSFMGKVKEEVKNRNRECFTKADVIAAIESIDEKTTWDKLLGKDAVPTLRRRFNEVRTFRNDVMHSQHISWEKYKEIQALFKKIDREMDVALQDLEVVESKSPNKPTFNQILEGALQTQEQLSAVAAASMPALEGMHYYSELLAQHSAFSDAMAKIAEISAGYATLPGIQAFIKQYEERLKEFQPSLDLLNQLKSEIPPELLRLQYNLNSFQIPDEETVLDESKEETDSEDKVIDDGGSD